MGINRRNVLLGGAATGFSLAAIAKPFPAFAATTIRLQLSWVSNVQYAGDWIAIENGFMERQGVSIDLIPGGPNAAPSMVALAAGTADIAYGNWFQFLDAVAQGNDFVAFAASFPRNPLGILSLAKKPILKPEDLVGARILAQAPNDKTAIEATLALAGLPNEWTWVPTGFSPEPLLAGDGDAFTAFSTNQPITLEKMGLVAGKDFHFVSFDELGYRQFGAMITTTRSYLDANRPAVVGYARALIQGWEENEKDPTVAARLTIEKFGADLGLDLDQQIRQNELQIPLTRYVEDGIPRLALDRGIVEGPMYTAARATGRANLPDVDKAFDFDVVREAHKAL